MLSISEPYNFAENSTGTQQLKTRWKKQTENKKQDFQTSLGRGGDKTPHQWQLRLCFVCNIKADVAFILCTLTLKTP